MDVEKLQKEELKGELAKRGEDVQGTKAILKERLQKVLQKELLGSEMEGGVSHTEDDKAGSQKGSPAPSRAGSNVSSSAAVKAERAIELAKQAGLLAKKEALKRKHELEAREAELRRLKEELEVEAEIEESKAKEGVLLQYEESVFKGEDKMKMLLMKDEIRTGQLAQEEAAEITRSADVAQEPTAQDATTQQARYREVAREPTAEDATIQQARCREVVRELAQEDGTIQRRRLVDVREREPVIPQEEIAEGRVTVMGDEHSRPPRINPDLQVLKRVNLPELKLRTFDGNIETFKSFLRAFKTNIASKLDDEEEKLMYLMQFTAGKPKEIVSTCIHLPPELGYQEAVRLLEQRFSNDAQTTEGLLNRILSQASMRSDDVSSLDSFAIHLRGTLNALRNLPHGTGVVDAKTMRDIIDKVPFLADRWRREVDHIECEERRRPDFTDLVAMIEKEARIASNPTYGRHVLASRTTRPAREPRSKQVSAPALTGKVSMVRTQQDLCLFCQQGHETDRCPKLEVKTHEEKTKFVRASGLCFSCMKKGHLAAACRQRSTCAKCNRRHPTVLHRPPRDSVAPARSPDPSADQPSPLRNPLSPDGPPAATAGHAAPKRENGGKLQVVPVVVLINGRRLKTAAFFDTGSTHSFITEQLISEAGMSPDRQTSMTVSTIVSDQKMSTSVVSGVTIENEETGTRQELPPLYTLNTIPVTEDDIPTVDDVRRWPYLLESGVTVSDEASLPVGLLIGGNAAVVMEPLRFVKGEDGGPYATLTRFGWILGGLKNVSSRCRVNRIKVNENDPMAEEWFENRAEVRRGLSVDDVKWCTLMEHGCVKKEKYEIVLPFRDQEPRLENNRSVAERRLELLRKKFERDKEYAEEYTTRMNKLLEDGHAEAAPEAREDSWRWYLPHFAVRHPTKETLRVVFDCASKYRGTSLNDTLLQGPDLTTPLVDVLLRFRQNPCAFTGDIEAMFLQVSVPESQRDYLRFLWWPEGVLSNPPCEYRMKVHLFGATSSPSCANFALHRTAADNDSLSREASETIRNNFYVDDVLKSVKDEETAIKLMKDLKAMCALGGFNLTKFNSNSIEVLQSVPKQDRSKQVKDLTLGSDPLPTERALGVVWDPNTDTIGFNVDMQKLTQKTATKRGYLSAAASCYDPLGLAAPCVVRARVIIQKLHRLAVGWDDKVPESLRREWEGWLTDLRNLSLLKIPRCLSPLGLDAALDAGDTIQLHHFADASSSAYGVVSYVRCVGDHSSCTLLFSRARLAPMKQLSVPRLELAAATLAVKSSLELQRALEVDADIYFWTDSTTVLKYIKNEKTRFHVFVANRLAVIHDGSTAGQWHYVPSESNPADLVSRGMNASSLVHSDLWRFGPSFLNGKDQEWPANPAEDAVSEADPEVKAVVMTTTCKDTSPIEKLTQYYSSWRRLVRAVALLRRLVLRWKKSAPQDVKTTARLTVSDLEAAESCILKDVQARHFSQELSDLKSDKPVSTSSSLVRLDPWLEGDTLRVGGRLRNSALPFDSKFPKILPGRDPVVDLLITAAHQNAGHEGRQHVLSDLRASYWIVGANTAVRRCLNRCIGCKKRQKQTEHQKMADLPETRLGVGDRAFTHTGVDYFGPFFVKQGRSQVKKYGVVFTCLAIRAVHLEVADDLSTDSFLCALRRFVARRGGVRSLRSDQGTNFIGAEKELKEEVNKLKQHEGEIHEAALRLGIDWRFHPPHASHFGGVWERQIRTIRKLLNALLTQQTFSLQTLQTLLCEVEAIINNRPLTPVSADAHDQPPLTPNHLLLLRSVVFPPSSTEWDHHRSWKQAGYLADLFWRRWRTEYLPLLQERSGRATRSRDNVKKGDIVLMVDDSVPRGVWPLGRVEEAIVSADGRVRSVRVRARGTSYYRPVTKIVKILDESNPRRE
ncbi:uncharacterized protein LOC122364821 [Amphibalanus amphitrite]|uniref:uncharacterized protein LOC122364821 n=1 Tax=Amphibalanus amphitrite TaxID=1232801 RepID=UPI001C905ECC|nr:uncharacterized protein LOC122364821 [Amphibalanus amphitrite]